MSKLEIAWFRYALIAHLADRIGAGTRFGKTALQKLSYLLQEAYNVPLGYEFKMYYYGPFCSALSGDLDYVDFLKGVNVEYKSSKGWYSIRPGTEKDRIISKGKEFLDENSSEIDKVIENFGGLSAKSLELRSTLIYVIREVEDERGAFSEAEIISRTGNLKPDFPDEEIRMALDELKTKELAG